jgi:hypothetical protein
MAPSQRRSARHGTALRLCLAAIAGTGATEISSRHEIQAGALIEIAFGQSEGFLDAQSGSPHDHDQSA